MDCRTFQDRIDEFLSGTLVAEAGRAAERHLESCVECRELVGFARGWFGAPLETAPDLTHDVLARTSGAACGRAESQLCEFVDETLETVDHELVRMHAESCSACSALVGAMRQMTGELPELAELRPDHRFVADVLSSTLPLDRKVSRQFDRLTDAWRRLVQRPRIAWEGAYLGTFVLALAFMAPSSPWSSLPQRFVAYAKVNPIEQLREPAADVETRLSEGAESLIRAKDSTRDATVDVIGRIKSDLGTFWVRRASMGESDDSDAPAQTEKRETEQGEWK